MALTDTEVGGLVNEALAEARRVATSPLSTEGERRVADETIRAILDLEQERIRASVARKAEVLRSLTTRLNALSAALQTGPLERAKQRIGEIATRLRDDLVEIGEDFVGAVARAPAAAPGVAISDKGLEIIKHFEGLELDAYQDVANIWTIGYGHTGNVTPGMTITEEEAEALLRQDVRTAERAVARRVTVELSQDQFDALVSWTYNLGEGNLRSSTLLRKLNAGDYRAVPDEMKRWNKVNGEVFDGLVRRRSSEATLWSSGEVGFDFA